MNTVCSLNLHVVNTKGPAGLAVKPLGVHLVIVGSIPTAPTHGEGRLQPHPGDVLRSSPTVRKSPRSGLNLEGRLSDPQIFNERGGGIFEHFISDKIRTWGLMPRKLIDSLQEIFPGNRLM